MRLVRLVPESMRLMIDAGCSESFSRDESADYELPMRTEAEAVSALSEACPSSGWVLMVMGAHHGSSDVSPNKARKMFSARVATASSRARSHGRAAACREAAIRVNGRWQFCSGVDHSEWVMLGCADPKTRGPGVHLVVPATRSKSMTPGT